MHGGRRINMESKTNRIGLTREDYKGLPSTLCSGCGHDAVTSKIIRAFFEAGIEPWRVAKFSGIGCSSKFPAYFLGRSAGFNGVHGRMPSVATGAHLANRGLVIVGVSGDGDTCNIGLGQFMHCVRRNIPIVYIIENNGVYGLTKGQFSATADMGMPLKTGEVNNLPPIDCCALAIELGCGFVARSFAGDPRQLVEILKAAAAHNGASVIDVISPCVTFNNMDASPKSYAYAKAHDTHLHEIEFVPHYEPIEDIEYAEGSARKIELADGSFIILRKLGADYDPSDGMLALKTIHEGMAKGEIITGIIHIDPGKKDFMSAMEISDEPLVNRPAESLRPSGEDLKEIMGNFR